MNVVTPLWSLPEQAPDCLLSGRPSGVGVRIAAEAMSRLLSVVRSRPTVEVGGLLFGPPPGGRDLLEVLSISGPGPRSVCEAHRYVPDLEHDLAHADRIRVDSGGARFVVGEFHSHPRGGRNPSRDDLSGFAQCRAGYGVERWLALIVAAAGHGGWTIERFVIRAGHGGADVCSPAGSRPYRSKR